MILLYKRISCISHMNFGGIEFLSYFYFIYMKIFNAVSFWNFLEYTTLKQLQRWSLNCTDYSNFVRLYLHSLFTWCILIYSFSSGYLFVSSSNQYLNLKLHANVSLTLVYVWVNNSTPPPPCKPLSLHCSSGSFRPPW